MAYPAAAQGISTPPPDCNNTPAYDFVIGNPLTTTDYDAGGGLYTFTNGTYHVVGNIRLLNGTFELKPGTKFYVDGLLSTFKGRQIVGGFAFIIGANAFMQADGVLFTAACNTTGSPAQASMWQGIWFQDNQYGQRLHLGNNCTVAYAQYGVYVPLVASGGTNYTQYDIQNTLFEQNFYHVLDYGLHDGRLAQCQLANFIMRSEPNLLTPYQASPDDTWTYEGLHLTPTGPIDGVPEVIVNGTNLIYGGIYGFVANQPGQAEIRCDGQLTIDRPVRMGIWFDDAKPIMSWPLQTIVNINSTTIYDRMYRSRWTLPGDPAYGVVAAAMDYSPTYSSGHVTVNGYNGGDTTNIRAQTGAFLSQVNKTVTNFSLNNLTYGMNIREGGKNIKGNTFNQCWHGLYVRPNAGYAIGVDVGCNSFQASSANTSSGILIANGAHLNQQGGPNSPRGNKFVGYFNFGLFSIMNRNLSTTFDYYRYAGSTDEQATAVTDGGSFFTGSVNSTGSTYTPSTFCQATRGVTGTGIQNRGSSQSAYIRALMDTLRQQSAPATRLEAYQLAIRQWLLVEQPDTAALETYVGTLATTNPEAFFGLGLDLLEQYRRVGRRVATARLRPLLAARIARYPAAANRLAVSDVVSRLATAGPLPKRQILPADSLTLRQVARTPGGEAETAALWFNYLYPGVGLRPALARTSGGTPPRQALGQAVVRALYPNPAADRLHVEVSAPTGAKVVALRLTELLSGRVVLQTELPLTKADYRAADVDVRKLPSGQYAALLTVDGVPMTTQKVLISR